MNNDKYEYAHNDTSLPERKSRTLSVNKYDFPEEVTKIRKSAFARNIPVSSEETLAFLCTCAEMAKPNKILEIGTAVGASGICLLQHTNATLTTIEINADFAAEAKTNFKAAGLSDRVNVLCGDAAEILPELECGYDFIFLDGAKVQYIKYLPQLKRLLNSGGVLFADDVLLYGWVNGESEVPKKRKMLVEHIREYLQAVQTDNEFFTTVVDVGDGVALSVKR